MTSFSWYSCLHIVRHLPSRMNCRRNWVSLDSFVLLVYLISRVRLVWFCNNIGLEGLIPWSGQDDEDENSEFSSSSSYPGVSEITPLDYFFFNFIGKIPYFCVKMGLFTHIVIRDLNSVSSSTDKTNLLGPIPARKKGRFVVRTYFEVSLRSSERLVDLLKHQRHCRYGRKQNVSSSELRRRRVLCVWEIRRRHVFRNLSYIHRYIYIHRYT
jgi:hypothetical protein